MEEGHNGISHFMFPFCSSSLPQKGLTWNKEATERVQSDIFW
jgi:hypothetical protein